MNLKKLGFKDLENAYQTYINSLIVNKDDNFIINVIMQNNIIFKDKTFV